MTKSSVAFFQLPFEKPSEIDGTLENLQTIKMNELSVQSQKLLSLSMDERQEFIAKNVECELQRPATIVAIDKTHELQPILALLRT